MSEQRVTTKADLLAETDKAWIALNAALDRLTPGQMTTLTDAQGWTVKDHVIHMTAWERSVVFFLQGQPRHAGLGVDEALYLNGSDDEINAVIYQQRKDLPLDDALAQFRAVHQQLLKLLQPLTDADLNQTYRSYLPDEPGDGDGPLAINVVYGNSARHFMEHLSWMEALVGKTPSPEMIILETKRLVLRRLRLEDLDSLFALYGDPEVRRYFPEGTLTYEETKQELEWFLNGHPEHPELGLWATIHRESHRFIGRCGLLPWVIHGRPEVEVAYMLAKEYWGQGLGTEAAQAILDYGFEKLQLPRLICLIDRENLASIKVARKIGMTFEKEGRDDKGPFLLYSRNKSTIV